MGSRGLGRNDNWIPERNELKTQNDELEALKKRLNTDGDKLTDDERVSLVKQIESKQKRFDRVTQDTQEDFTNQQQEIASRILQKMAPLVVKYSRENGFGIVVDTSKPWPQSSVLWSSNAVDVTTAVVEAYNSQSGTPRSNSNTRTSSGTDYDHQLKSANALYKNNQFPEAMQAAGALIQADPNRWEGYGLTGAIQEAQNKLAEAKAAYQRALSLAPDSVKPQITQAIQQIETEQQKP